jgi:hypothetical protein
MIFVVDPKFLFLNWEAEGPLLPSFSNNIT